MPKCLRILAIVTAVILIGAACGGSDDSGSPFSSDTAASDSAAPGDSGSDDGGDSGGVFGSDGIPDEIGDIPGFSGECEDLANMFLSMASIFVGGDVAEFNADTFSALPGDLQDDAAIVAEGLNEVVAGIADLGLDLSNPESLASMTQEQAAAFGELSSSFDDPAFNEALDNIEAYASAECDDFGGG